MTMPAAMKFPADPALRRQLWRQWVHLDEPTNSTTATVTRLRLAPKAPSASTDESKVTSTNWTATTIDATPGVVDGLRAAIAAAVVNGQLSNADRARLIGRGVRLGLSRFDASLLVAAVQHEAAQRCDYRVVREWKQKPTKRRSVMTIVSACLAFEAVALTVFAAWLKA